MLLTQPTGQDGARPGRRGGAVLASRAEAARRRRLQRELACAIGNGGFALGFHPRLSLDTGRQVGAAALVRWPHPRHGHVPPSVFGPLAAATGQGVALGGWALATACRAAAAWDETWTVSVGVSADQIDGGMLLGQVAVALESSGLDPERLELAMTEASLTEVGLDKTEVGLDKLLLLSAIRDQGVGIALDDFGTGLASLVMLRRLPLTAMKLDRSLIRDLPADREDAAIMRAVITAAHAIGLRVVADCIETEPQRAFLAGCGCDEGQGSLFGTASAADAFRCSAEAPAR